MNCYVDRAWRTSLFLLVECWNLMVKRCVRTEKPPRGVPLMQHQDERNSIFLPPHPQIWPFQSFAKKTSPASSQTLPAVNKKNLEWFCCVLLCSIVFFEANPYYATVSKGGLCAALILVHSCTRANLNTVLRGHAILCNISVMRGRFREGRVRRQKCSRGDVYWQCSCYNFFFPNRWYQQSNATLFAWHISNFYMQ